MAAIARVCGSGLLKSSNGINMKHVSVSSDKDDGGDEWAGN